MREIVALVVVGVEVRRKVHGYVVAAVRLRERLRILDIVVVLYAAVHRLFDAVSLEVGVCGVFVSPVISVDTSSEGTQLRLYVVSSAVVVVYLETDACILVYITCEVGSHAVFSRLLVAAGVIGQIGHRRLGVREAEVEESSQEEVVGRELFEVPQFSSVEEDAVETRASRVSQE